MEIFISNISNICGNYNTKVTRKNILLINKKIHEWYLIKDNENVKEVLLNNISHEDNFSLLMDNFNNIEKFIENNPHLKD